MCTVYYHIIMTDELTFECSETKQEKFSANKQNKRKNFQNM